MMMSPLLAAMLNVPLLTIARFGVPRPVLMLNVPRLQVTVPSLVQLRPKVWVASAVVTVAPAWVRRRPAPRSSPSAHANVPPAGIVRSCAPVKTPELNVKTGSVNGMLDVNVLPSMVSRLAEKVAVAATVHVPLRGFTVPAPVTVPLTVTWAVLLAKNENVVRMSAPAATVSVPSTLRVPPSTESVPPSTSTAPPHVDVRFSK